MSEISLRTHSTHHKIRVHVQQKRVDFFNLARKSLNVI